MYLFSIQDVKTGKFNPPFSATSVPDVQRSYVAMMRDPQHAKSMFVQFPEDYRVFRVAAFSIDMGEVHPTPGGPEFLFNMTDIVPQNGGVK